MIRQLQSNEVGLLAPSVQSFFKEGALPGGLDVAHFLTSWRRLIESKVGVVFGAFKDNGEFAGSLGAVMAPNLCAPNAMAIECFWFMVDRKTSMAIRLLREFERWAKVSGAKLVAMIHLENLQPVKLAKLYVRMGYRKVEVHYVKEVA